MKKTICWIKVILFSLMFISACSSSEEAIATSVWTPTPGPTLTLTDTRIIIDGLADDWNNREVLLDDPAGDTEEGYLDMTTGYAFVNQHSLYFLVEIVDPEAPFVHFDIEFQADDRRILISWKPGEPDGSIGDITTGFNNIGPATSSTFALSSSLEGRVDLSDIGSPENLNLTQIRVMVGECCESPAWRAADEWNPGSTPVVNEVDPSWLVSDEYVIARHFKLPEDYVAELLFAPPAPDLTGIARSQNGVVYLQQGESNAGISTLDPTSGEVRRILDLPPDEIGYGPIVGGPNDTAFIPVGNKIWQVRSDGSHMVWGQVSDGDVKFFTYDGRLLGYSYDGTRVLELIPDGSSHDVASGFTDICDIVGTDDGTLFVSDCETGDITRVDLDGTQRVLAERVVFRDPLDLAIDPSGNLFLNSVASGFVQVDRNNGTFTRYDSAHSDCTIHQADFEFEEQGRAIFVDPTWSTVTWADLDTRQNGILVSNQGVNTWAAVGPDDALYVGAWGCSDEIPAQVVRITDNGTREVYVDGLHGQVSDIAFAPDGGLYIATHDPGRDGPVFYVPPEGGDLAQIPGVEGLSSLAVDPLSGHLLATKHSGSSILEITPEGLLSKHPIQLPMPAFDFFLDIAPDGTLYAYAAEAERFFTGPEVERWVLRIDLDSGLAEIVFQFDRQGCCVMGNLSVGPQGTIWWMVDPEFLIYRVTPDGDATIFAQNLPTDPAAVVEDSQGDIYFTSPSGIYRIFLDE